MIPRATARLQLNAGFTFDDARQTLEHHAALGISHLYLSPITRARPGSAHGYDVLDPTRVSDELGGMAGLRRLAAAAAGKQMGLIIDIVPNHMAADPRNPWWRDVLKHGADSARAPVFDIDWTAHQGRVLLPILARPYGDALAAGDIRLTRQDDGELVVLAGDSALPLASDEALSPEDFNPQDAGGRARLSALLEQQHYRLAWWRCAASRLNWRRFFTVNELVGVRVEDPQVFQATHALILDIWRQGLAQGLRVDHIDGLATPGRYLRRLREAMIAEAPSSPPYLIVEKILAPGETLDPRWPVDGTTGYDFMNDVSALLHAPAAQRPLLAFWKSCGGLTTGHHRELRDLRAHILTRHLDNERQAAATAWIAAMRTETGTGDGDAQALHRVLDAWLAGFPTYRSYAEDGGASAADRAMWETAAHHARSRIPASDRALLDRWMQWLSHPSEQAASALRRLQQLMPPLAAKSLEDTLFYRMGMLLSRNEVGASLDRFSLDTSGFHQRNAYRAQCWPRSMLATATHDHKRGEDVRARLAVLTEMPHRWTQFATRWLAAAPAGQPTLTDRYMLLQTLVGSWPASWPADIRSVDPDLVRHWLARVADWQRKALREAKLHTSWQDPEPAYENAANAYLGRLAPDAADPRPLASLSVLTASLIAPGHVNSLAQTLLRNTVPGIPDLYQGTEVWDESLVDPDNRRPIDYRALDRQLASALADTPSEAEWRSGRVKQHVIQVALRARLAQPAVFGPDAAYVPLVAHGPRAGHVVAFLRTAQGRAALTVVPRLCALSLAGYASGKAEEARTFWHDTAVALPADHRGRWDSLLDGAAIETDRDGRLPLDRLLWRWPVALAMTAAADRQR